jgi:hypothetical protein
VDLKCSLSKVQMWATGVPFTRHMQRFDKSGPLFAYGGLTDPGCPYPYLHFRRASTTPTAYLRGCRKHKALQGGVLKKSKKWSVVRALLAFGRPGGPRAPGGGLGPQPQPVAVTTMDQSAQKYKHKSFKLLTKANI